jgi:hypothetical protein
MREVRRIRRASYRLQILRFAQDDKSEYIVPSLKLEA